MRFRQRVNLGFNIKLYQRITTALNYSLLKAKTFMLLFFLDNLNERNLMYKNCLLSTVFVMALAAYPAMAQEREAPKWGPHIEAEGKWGTDRSLGEFGAFMPVWQNEDTLMFADIRGRLDDQSSREGNFGLGLRHQLNQDWILGGYGFYDRRRTGNDNHYHQATIGIEALSETMEFRFNGYLPERGAQDVGASTSVASTDGASFQITTTGPARERALPGFDVEAGYKFNLPDNWDFWAYGGGFHFDADDVDNVSGARGRVEFNYNNVPYMGEGSRLTLGYEVQHDDVRDTQGFAIARLRVPLNFNGKAQGSTLSDLDQRMTTRIIRDIDVVTGASKGEVTTENATTTLASGTDVSSFTRIDATDDITTEVNDAGNNALILLDGSAGVIDTGTAVTLSTGQTLIGGGSNLTVTGVTSGTTATVSLPGTRATVNGTNAVTSVFGLATVNQVTMKDFNITGGLHGILTLGGTPDNLTLDGLNISAVTNNGLHFNAATNVSIRNLSITDPGSNGMAFNGTVTGISFENVTIEDTGANALTIPGQLNNPSGSITTTGIVGQNCLDGGIITGSTLLINGVLCD